MPVKKCIEKLKKGNREVIKEAQKELGEIFHKKLWKDGVRNDRLFEEFVDEIKHFDEIEGLKNREAFLNSLKWPFMILRDKHFEFFQDFVLKIIQYPSGTLRIAVVRAAEWLMTSLYPFEEKGTDFEIDKKKYSDSERKEIVRRNRARLFEFVSKTENLMGEYNEPRFSKYKYVSSMPASVYKSLQMLITEVLLRSPHQEKIYKEEQLRAMGAETKIPNYINVEDFKSNPAGAIREADSLMHKREFSQAISLIKGVLNELPSQDKLDSYGYYLLGIARMKCGRFFLAKEAMEKAVELFPDNSKNLQALGWIKVMIGDIEEGRQDINKAIKEDMTNAHAYMDLAMSYIHYFEFEKGFELLEIAKSFTSGDGYIGQNYKIAKGMEKELSKYSKAELAKMRKEKLYPKTQKEFRLAFIEQFMASRKFLTRDELSEVTEELKRNGLSGDIAVLEE